MRALGGRSWSTNAAQAAYVGPLLIGGLVFILWISGEPSLGTEGSELVAEQKSTWDLKIATETPDNTTCGPLGRPDFSTLRVSTSDGEHSLEMR